MPALPEEIQKALTAAGVLLISALVALALSRLNSLNKSLNHKPKGAPTISEQVDETHSTALDLLDAIAEMREEQNDRHKATEDRIRRVENNAERLSRSVTHLTGAVANIGEALGVDPPPEPWNPSMGDRRRDER